MIEPDRSNAGEAGAPPAAPTQATAGALLRAAREAQGLHIAALATAIKVTPRKVEALESNRLHELPDVTFARALAQTICRQLKLDPQPVLALLPPNGTIALEPASRIQSTPYRDRAGRSEQGSGRRLGPLMWGAVVLLVAAAAIVLLPASGWWGLGLDALTPAAPASAAAPAAPAASAAPGATAPAAPGAAVSSTAPVASVSLALPISASSTLVTLFALSPPAPAAAAAGMGAAGALPVLAASLTSGPARAAGAETVFSAPPPSAGVAPAVSGALVVTTTDASWVEVRDAKGQTLLSEIVQPGRSIGVDGALPFRLLVGNAAATQLVFMGRAVDVMARARENVARFDLQ